MSNVILNSLEAPKHVLDDIELIPHPNHGLGGQFAIFGTDHHGDQTGWWIFEDSDDRRDDPDSPRLIGQSHNDPYLPDLEPVKTLSRNHPKDIIAVECYRDGDSPADLHRYEFLNGDLRDTTAPVAAVQRFDAAYAQLASAGRVDSLGGMQYRYTLSRWADAYCPDDIAAFIAATPY